MDDLDPSQFNLLVKVLSLPSSARDFIHLLMPVNLKDVFDLSAKFVLSKVSHLNFEGLGGAPTKEQIQRCLLSRIQAESKA